METAAANPPKDQKKAWAERKREEQAAASLAFRTSMLGRPCTVRRELFPEKKLEQD